MKKVIALSMGLLSFSAVSQAADIEAKYNQSCIACHASGVAGAPVTYNDADWAPRMAKGMDVLVNNVKKGINAMPPKGMCMDCSDEDYKALIHFMATAR
jgi:cytochrome c5